MRKIFTRQQIMLCCITLLTVFFGYNEAKAQGEYNTVNWRFSNPKPFGFTVFDVDHFDNSNIIAVGADGGIAKSVDGGTNWTYGPFTYLNNAGLRVKGNFLDVHYSSLNTAYAVGNAGCMAKTTNGGATWTFVNTPLFANGRDINTCWFLDDNRGYIGGQFNTPDSIAKVYFTLNGGSTWDSLASPIPVGKTVVGFVNNPNLAPLQWDINHKNKQIYRIKFLNNNTAYVIGSASGLFPAHPNANSTTCVPTGTTIGTSANDAPLVWKLSNGVLTDFSPTKERLGYTGINTTNVTCGTRFGNISAGTQQYRAMNIINDSTIVMMSFNNNIVLKVSTGRNDSTLNPNVAGLYEKGKYVHLNYPFPVNGGTPIPSPQVLLASNPYNMVNAANGKLYAPGNFGRLWTSIDTGRNWIQENSLPQGQNFSSLGTWAIDIAPSGKFLFMGTNGVKADSTPGGVLASNYFANPGSVSHTDAEFADCNNGMLTGGSSITVTEDGGATWIDKNRPDFTASFYSIGGVAYPTLTKAYFAVSNGIVYVSPDKGTTLDPALNDFNYRMLDVDAQGNDTVWAVGNSQFTVPAANRTSSVFRSYNGGTTWTTIGGFPSGATGNESLSKISFGSPTVGYVCGARNAIYKTIDAGSTWTKINPFPALNDAPPGFPNARITYTEIKAISATEVFAIGNMFTNTGIKRVYKSIDAGALWIDITGNIPTIFPVGNLIGLAVHDANNLYVTAGSALFKTTDGGANWTMDLAPTNSLFETMAFSPAKVPAAIQFQNRKLFVTGVAAPTSNGSIMEYGNPANISVNSTELVANASCTSVNGGTITATATGGLAPYSYSINNGTFQNSNVFSGLAQGTYNVMIKDAFCGIITKQVVVGFTNNLTAVASRDTTVCSGAPVQLNVVSAATGFSWSPSTALTASNIRNPIARPTATTTYRVTATLGTCTTTATTTITIKANPFVSAGPDKTIVGGQSTILNGSGATSPTSISWTPAATLIAANTYTPTATPTATTTYQLTVLDNNGCTSTDDAIVTVIPYCVDVKNAFTPNGDGINDRWLVTSGGACTKQISVQVFNRYGALVYKNDNYQNNWDGTYNGRPVSDGTYYYNIMYKLIDDRTILAKGDVTILR